LTLHTLQQAADSLDVSKRVLCERLRDAEQQHPEVTWRDK
jgi:hypothetical protein